MTASALMSKIYTLHRSADATVIAELRRTLEQADVATLERALKYAEMERCHPDVSQRVKMNMWSTAKVIHAELVKRRGY